MQTLTNQGLAMPKLGLGTYRMQGDTCRQAVGTAIELGYRHIDTAQMYGNEAPIGAAIADTGIPRAELHITTKVWWQNLAPAAMRQAMAESLEALRTAYVDLYLIHWPAPEMNLGEALETLTALQQEGKARHIGVSNFPTALLRRAVEEIRAPIVVDQVEHHALLGQPAIRRYAAAHDIAVIAYAPLAQGRLAEQPVLAEIARKHGAEPSQIALKWLLDQPGMAAIPKAARQASQASNLAALDLTLDDADRAAIDALPKDQRFVNPGFAPAWDR